MNQQEIARLLAPAIRRDPLHTAEYYSELMRQPNVAIFNTENAAMVAQIVEMPGGRLCECVLAGSNANEGLHDIVHVLRPDIEQWAVQNSCQWADVTGRKGWERSLRNFGYKFADVTLRKELCDG